MSKTKAKIKKAAYSAKKRFHNFIAGKTNRYCSSGGALCDSHGSVLDVALDVIIGVVIAAIILLALKQLFNVDILPPVTSKITGLFS
jgi:hypothetical protein